MKSVTLIPLIALSVFAFTLPSISFADDHSQSGGLQQQLAKESESSYEQCSQPESGNLLDRIAEAVADILGPEEPLGSAHPSDYNPPSAGPDMEDGGWADQWK